MQAKGHAVARQEHCVGLLGVAAPVRGADGRILASLALAIPMVRLNPEAEPGLDRAMQEIALALSQRLGFLPASPPPVNGGTPLGGARSVMHGWSSPDVVDR